MSSWKLIFYFHIFWRLKSKLLRVHWKNVKISAEGAHPQHETYRIFLLKENEYLLYILFNDDNLEIINY